jgi:hypothetical protein
MFHCISDIQLLLGERSSKVLARTRFRLLLVLACGREPYSFLGDVRALFLSADPSFGDDDDRGVAAAQCVECRHIIDQSDTPHAGADRCFPDSRLHLGRFLFILLHNVPGPDKYLALTFCK